MLRLNASIRFLMVFVAIAAIVISRLPKSDIRAKLESEVVGWRINDVHFGSPFCLPLAPATTLNDVRHVVIFEQFDVAKIDKLKRFQRLEILCIPKSLVYHQTEFRAAIPATTQLHVY